MYEFLQDQGSFIAGLLILAAGVLAYLAGRAQATATRESANAQVSAICDQMNQAHEDAVAQIRALERQLEQRDREIADLQRKEADLQREKKVEIVRALATESARLRRFARDRLLIAENHYSSAPDLPIGPDTSPYQIKAGNVLNKVGVVDFRGTGIMPAATNLNAMIDVLSSALESAGAVGALKGGPLIGHLNNVISSAEALKALLETWERNNPVSL